MHRHAEPVASVVLAIGIFLVAAKLGGNPATRLGQAAVLGELLVDVFLGNLAVFGVPGGSGKAAGLLVGSLALGVCLSPKLFFLAAKLKSPGALLAGHRPTQPRTLSAEPCRKRDSHYTAMSAEHPLSFCAEGLPGFHPQSMGLQGGIILRRLRAMA